MGLTSAEGQMPVLNEHQVSLVMKIL
jgi:hypothetical protein